MHEWLLSLAGHPRSRQWIIALAILLVLPSLAAGFFADDFGHYLLINEPGLIPQSKQGSPFHLFSFIDDDPARRQLQYSQSLIPWWTSESLTVNFWRPASELLHYPDYAFFPDRPWIMHLHSIFWYFLLLLLVSCFYKNIFSQAHLSVIALLFFAVDATHGMTVAWLANRNAMVSAVFALLAFLMYSRFRLVGRRLLLLPFGMALIASLLSAEIGITVAGFLGAYALFLDKDGPVKGFFQLWPLLIILVIWQLVYRYLGYGVSGSAAFYVDPFGSPVLYLQSLLLRFPLAISVEFNLLPIHLVSFLEKPAAFIGVLIFLALLVVAIRKKDASFNFFLLSLSLAVLPVATTVIQDRNMLFVSIAGAGIIAKLVGWLAEARRVLLLPWLAGFFLALILFFHLLVSALLMIPMAIAPGLLAKNSISAALSIRDYRGHGSIVSFGIPLFDAGYLSAIRKVYGLSIPDRFWNITTFTDDISVQRLPANHLLITGRQGLIRRDDLLLRNLAQEPLYSGQVFDLYGLNVRIIETNRQGIPVVVELIPGKELVDAGYKLVYWQDGDLIPFSLDGNEIRHFYPGAHASALPK